jgi:hypothetical protein
VQFRLGDLFDQHTIQQFNTPLVEYPEIDHTVVSFDSNPCYPLPNVRNIQYLEHFDTVAYAFFDASHMQGQGPAILLATTRFRR